MSRTGFVVGIFSILSMCIGFVPTFGWIYWFILPFALAGLVVCILGYKNSFTASGKNQSVAGIVLSLITLILGSLRWFLGGFYF